MKNPTPLPSKTTPTQTPTETKDIIETETRGLKNRLAVPADATVAAPMGQVKTITNQYRGPSSLPPTETVSDCCNATIDENGLTKMCTICHQECKSKKVHIMPHMHPICPVCKGYCKLSPPLEPTVEKWEGGTISKYSKTGKYLGEVGDLYKVVVEPTIEEKLSELLARTQKYPGDYPLSHLYNKILELFQSSAQEAKAELIKRISDRRIDEKSHNKLNKHDPDIKGKWWSKGWNSGYNQALNDLLASLKQEEDN